MTASKKQIANGGTRAMTLDEQGPPHDSNAEAAVLSALVCLGHMDDSAEVVNLKPDDFFQPQHRAIFDAMKELVDAGKPIDGLLLAAHLKARGNWEAIGAAAGFSRIINAVPNVHFIRHYAELVCDKSRERENYRFALRIAEEVKDGLPWSDVLGTIQQHTERMEAQHLGSGEVELLSLADLVSGDFSTSYHVPGILAQGQPAIVAAPLKALKTSVCMDLCLSLASGRHFLGKWPVNQTNTLFLSGESGKGALQQLATRICASKGIGDLEAITGFQMSEWLPRFDAMADLAKLRRTIIRAGAGIVFIDPIYLCIDGDDANNLFAMGKQLRGVAKVAKDTGTTLVLVHHFKKTLPDMYSQPELAWLSWSGFAEFARQWLLLNRRETYESGSGDHRLWLTAGGSAGHGGAWGLDVSEGVISD
ncbi:MAG TPA: AAA family ATPase, partial [Pirellulaceae bacterium]|nr:AAA family ATPase [Pirellulaceae bacterium]